MMNILLLQSGGPTAVINASLWGGISAGQIEPGIGRVWGARLGWQGLVSGDWVDLTRFANRVPPYLERLPGAALGGGRFPLADELLPQALDQLAAHQIRGVIALGGNGTMAAAQKLQDAADRGGYWVEGQPLAVVGVAKTIDNDLAATDFAPGYPSAARFVAQTVHDVGLDLHAMRNFDDVAVIEVMGRHGGWLAAASALARIRPDDPPHLILLPEAPVDEERLLDRIRQVHAERGVCLVVASEGVRDLAGRFLTEKGADAGTDATGQRLLSLSSGVAAYLARRVQDALGLRCRQMRPDTIQRSASSLVSQLDQQQAQRLGSAAVEALVSGQRGVMLGLRRHPHGWTPVPIPFANVIGHSRALPADWIDADAFDVTEAFLAYARPLAEVERGRPGL
jgi:6-phosphofructokinase 1